MKIRGLAVVALAASFVLLGFPSQPRAEQGDMRVQFGVLYSIPTDDLSEDGQTTELDDALGAQVSFEYSITDLIGIEPAIDYTELDVTVKESGLPDLDLGEIESFSLTVNLNFHVLRGERLDLFAGPVVGYTSWSDLESELFQESFPADDEFVYGVNVGVDVPFGNSSWGFSGAVDYLVSDITLQGADGQELGFSPIRIKLGASFRF